MSEWPYRQPGRAPGEYCVHGTHPLHWCGKCDERNRLEAREERLYEVLDRLAVAVDGLARIGVADRAS